MTRTNLSIKGPFSQSVLIKDFGVKGRSKGDQLKMRLL